MNSGGPGKVIGLADRPKTPSRSLRWLALVLVSSTAPLLPQTAAAQSLHWNLTSRDGTVGSCGHASSGTWDGSLANWSPSSAGTASVLVLCTLFLLQRMRMVLP